MMLIPKLDLVLIKMMKEVQTLEQYIYELESIVQSIPDHIFLISESGTCIALFEGTDKTIDFDYQKLVGMSFQEAFPSVAASEMKACLEKALICGTGSKLTYHLNQKDVQALPEHLRVDCDHWFEGRVKPLPFQKNGEKVVMWIARNITDKHLLELEVKRLAQEDELTGLYNRRYFMKQLKDAYTLHQRYAQPTSFLMFDIDDFKHINDRYGHLAGDEVIRQVSNRCRSIIRECDVMARIGGEEFALLLPQTELSVAQELAERIRLAVCSNPVIVEKHLFNITVSIGGTEVLQQDSGHSEVLRRADAAMYRSKRSGKNKTTCA